MGRITIKVLVLFAFFLIIPPSSSKAFPEFEFFPLGGYNIEPTLDKIRLGRVRVQPGIALESRFTDNLFLTADKTFVDGTFEGRNEDMIFSIKPSLFAILERTAGEPFGFYLFYRGEDQHYVDLAASQNALLHNTGGALNFGGPGGKADFTVGGSYHKTNSFIGLDFRSNLGNRIGVESYVGFTDLVYTFSRIFKAHFRADVIQNRFGPLFSLIQDVDTYNFNISLFKQADQILAYGFKYNHRVNAYKNASLLNDSSISHQVFFSVKWSPTPLITSEVSVGFEFKKFKRFSSEDINQPIFQVELTYKPYDRTEVMFRGTREIYDSTFQNIQNFVQTGGELGLSQKMGKKFTLETSAQLDYRDYRKPAIDFQGGFAVRTRVDKLIKASTAFIYDIKDWLQVKAEYIYEENISNFDDNDFISNTGLIEVGIKY